MDSCRSDSRGPVTARCALASRAVVARGCCAALGSSCESMYFNMRNPT